MFAAQWEKVKQKFDETKQNANGIVQAMSAKHDKYKSLMEMVTDYNYPIEKYFYTTQDGYINCVFRISGQKGSRAWLNKNEKKPVILYQHGFLDAGATICCDGPNSLAFYLVDNGFDLWLANTRGNRFSRHHTYLDPDTNEKFWDFSFQEMADYDQPALFDFILSKTGVENLTYIGHSQGTQQMFAALSENLGFFKDKINVAIMLAPVTRVDRMTCGTAHNLKDNNNLFSLFEGQGPEIMPCPQVGNKITGGLLWVTGIASFSLGMISDEDTKLISTYGQETYFGHYPSGSSYRNLNHFRQILLSGKFSKYDFGPEENLKKYGQEKPPEYNLKNIKDVPIALFCGLRDRLASPGDYRWLKEEIGPSVVYYREFNIGHMGFLLPADNTHFKEIIDLAKTYNKYCYQPPVNEPLLLNKHN